MLEQLSASEYLLPHRMQCHAVIIARRYDIPYSGIAECKGSYWLFDRVREPDDNENFLLFPLSACNVSQLLEKLFPDVYELDKLLGIGVVISPVLFNRGVDDTYRSIWNQFVATMDDSVHQAGWATVDLALSEILTRPPAIASAATSVAMTFSVRAIKLASIPKSNLTVPLASSVRPPHSASKPEDSQEMPF